MKRTLLSLIFGVVIMALAASAAHAEAKDTLISVTGEYWMPTVDAKVRSSDLSVVGTDINFIDDLGLDDSETVPSLRGSLDLPILPEILFSYFKVDSDATKTLTQAVTYDGVTYNISDVVTSSYKIEHYEALMALNLINTDSAKFGLLIGAKYFKVDTSLSSVAAGSRSDSIDGPVPVIGAMLGLGTEKVRLELLGRGLSVSAGDVDASLFDLQADLNYDFNRFFRVGAGYRYFAINAEDSSTDDKADIKFAGPYVSITGSF